MPGLGLSAAIPARSLALLPEHPAQIVELPAYGLRAPRSCPLDPEALAVTLLQRTPERASVLLGHSASAQIVAAAAARAPHRVAALVLVGPTTDPRAASWPALAARWLRTARHERVDQLPLLLHDYTRTGLPSMARGMDAARRHSIADALAAVTAPVLVLRGRHDEICPPDWAADLAAGTPHGRAESLHVGAHMVPWTHPVELAAEVRGISRHSHRRSRMTDACEQQRASTVHAGAAGRVPTRSAKTTMLSS
ncbi:MAG TPA: alpha/beta fold hydrolase [Pseudonocardia sp.]